MMTLKQIITAFIDAQRYVCHRLRDEYALPESIPGVRWALSQADMEVMHEAHPIAEIFRPHGCGLEFKDSHVHVDREGDENAARNLDGKVR